MSREKSRHEVTVFTPYEFRAGQKIHIDGGPRKGDWEVVAVNENKVRLKCPVSLREFEWDRFCYHAGARFFDTWPSKD